MWIWTQWRSLVHGCLSTPDPQPQMASRSSQPFFWNQLMVEAIEVHPSIQLRSFHMLQQLPTRMCRQNDILVTSSDAYICRNIYSYIVVITHIMHIHRLSIWLVLKITCCLLPIGKINALVCQSNVCCLRSRKSKSLLHFGKFLVNCNFDVETN